MKLELFEKCGLGRWLDRMKIKAGLVEVGGSFGWIRDFWVVGNIKRLNLAIAMY